MNPKGKLKWSFVGLNNCWFPKFKGKLYKYGIWSEDVKDVKNFCFKKKVQNDRKMRWITCINIPFEAPMGSEHWTGIIRNTSFEYFGTGKDMVAGEECKNIKYWAFEGGFNNSMYLLIIHTHA